MTAENKGEYSSSLQDTNFPNKLWKYLQFCPSFRKPQQSSPDAIGLSTGSSRVVAHVASQGRAEACLEQKSHPPPHDSPMTLADHLQLGVQVVNLGVSSCSCLERPETWLLKAGHIPAIETSCLCSYCLCRSCEISTQNTAFVLFSFNCQPYKFCFIIEHQVKFFPSYS